MATIILNPEDIPSKEQLEQSAVRLKKCADILKDFKGKKNKEDPKALLVVAQFIEMLSKR